MRVGAVVVCVCLASSAIGQAPAIQEPQVYTTGAPTVPEFFRQYTNGPCTYRRVWGNQLSTYLMLPTAMEF